MLYLLIKGKREEKSFKLVNEKLKLFISYFDISIQSLQQKDINTLFKRNSQLIALYSVWFTDNKLALNVKKTNYAIFSIGLKFDDI